MNPDKETELLQVLDRVKCPPGGWSWTDSITETRFVAVAYSDLLHKVRDFWKANNISVPDNWLEIFDDTVCRQNNIEDTHCGAPRRRDPIPSDRKLGPHDLLNFLRTISEWVSKGLQFVEPEEAARRAAICATCPKNVVVDGCSGCSGVLAYVRDLLARRASHRGTVAKTTPFDEQLNNCEVCGCVLEVKVHLPLEVATYAKPAGGRVYPDHCWMSQVATEPTSE